MQAKEPESLSEVIRNACLGSTIRGVKKIVSERSRFWRFVWLLTVILFFSVAIYTASSAVSEYLTYPVKTIELIDAPNKFELPAITLCQPGILAGVETEGLFRKLSKRNKTLISLIDSFKEYPETQWIKFSTLANILLRGFYRENGANIIFSEEHILNCQLRHFEGKMSKTDYTSCMNTEFIRDNDCITLFPPSPKSNTYGSQYYSFNVFLDNFPDSKPEMFSPKYNKLFSKHGIYYMIHDRDLMMPNLGYFIGNAYYTPPGYEINVNAFVRAHEYLPHPYGTCAEDIDHFDHTTCIRGCLLDQVAETCHCINEEMSYFDKDTLDSYHLPNCFRLGQKIRPMVTELSCVLNLQLEVINVCQKDCQEPCAQKKYLENHMTVHWPSYEDVLQTYDELIKGREYEHKFKIYQWIANETDQKAALTALKNQTLINENFVRFQITLNQEGVRQYKQVPDYTFWKLAANLGGTMSLWVGLTLMVFVEIFQIIYDLVSLFIRTKVKKRKKESAAETMTLS